MDEDWALLQAAPGNHTALATLFQRHKDYVYRLAWGVLGAHEAAEDVVQEVFLKLGNGAMRWRPRALFRTWLYRVVLNTASEVGRRHRREELLAQDSEQPCEHPASDPLRTAALADLIKGLATLPQRQREVVVLRFLEGCSTRETARILGCGEGTVKVHLHRASLALQARYGDTGQGNDRKINSDIEKAR